VEKFSLLVIVELLGFPMLCLQKINEDSPVVGVAELVALSSSEAL